MCCTGSSAGMSSTWPNRVRVPSAFQNCGAVNPDCSQCDHPRCDHHRGCRYPPSSTNCCHSPLVTGTRPMRKAGTSVLVPGGPFVLGVDAVTEPHSLDNECGSVTASTPR